MERAWHSEALAVTIWVVGSYGNGNVGDDMLGHLAAAFIATRTDQRVVVLAGDGWPFGGAESQRRSHVFRAVRRGDVICVCGGGLLNDEFDTLFLRYFASLSAIAVLRGARIHYVAIGVERLKSVRSRFLAWCALLPAQSVSVRDSHSLSSIRSVTRKARLRADLGWLAESVSESLPHAGEREPFIVVTIAVERESNFEGRVRALGAVVTELLSKDEGLRVILLPMQRSDVPALDDRVALELLGQGLEGRASLIEVADYREVLGILRRSVLVVGYRLHAAVLGAVARTPLVALSRSPKVAQALEGLDSVAVGLDENLVADDALVELARLGRELIHRSSNMVDEVAIKQRSRLAREALEEVIR